MAKICMNHVCQATATFEWKKGWGLSSGGFATLCFYCGSAYENLVYCEMFHKEESGWRECRLCRKRIHCGCIASKYMHDYLDFGGVGCKSCTKSSEVLSKEHAQIWYDDNSRGFGMLTANNNDPQSSHIDIKICNSTLDNGTLTRLSEIMNAKELYHFPQTQRSNTSSPTRQTKQGGIMLPIGELGSGPSDLRLPSGGSSILDQPENTSSTPALKDIYESLVHQSLDFSLSTHMDTPCSALPSSSGPVEQKEQDGVLPVDQGQRTDHISPRTPKTSLNIGSEGKKGISSQMRIARPPADKRVRSQLLPRYWPRISDQELQQISGDLKSTVVPLFEKVLTVSDAGRIGRVVLPKACAEAFFPPISQSEGVPINVQDIKGKEWTFQFRYWPNNNSRMYVLEGTNPCIQNMELQAGDTVIFTRIDPVGKLVMGFRKTSNSVDIQDSQGSALCNGAPSKETPLSGVNNNRPTKKGTRNVGSKSKRLLMHNEDAMELILTWEEAQELLQPTPNATPNIVIVEDHEFEEYDDPPVFGMRTIFMAQVPGCSSSAHDEVVPEEFESLLRVGKDFKKRRITETTNGAPEHEPSGLDALATAAVLGDIAVNSGEPSLGPTKHPQHCPECTCFVCLHPSSGKGKHKSTCVCKFCSTIECRLKTFIYQKKKGESEAEMDTFNTVLEVENRHGNELLCVNSWEDARSLDGILKDEDETRKSQLDLNCCPDCEEDTIIAETTGLSMRSLDQATGLSMEMYSKQREVSQT